jgi:hypothetical protein
MKKVSFILAGLVILGLVYSYENAKGETNGLSQNATTQYIIIKYLPATNQDVVVYSGENKIQHFSITKEQKFDFGTLNLAIDLMNKYEAEGYTLVSTHNDGVGTQLFLRKTK